MKILKYRLRPIYDKMLAFELSVLTPVYDCRVGKYVNDWKVIGPVLDKAHAATIVEHLSQDIVDYDVR